MSAVTDLYLVERRALLARLRPTLSRLARNRSVVLGIAIAGLLLTFVGMLATGRSGPIGTIMFVPWVALLAAELGSGRGRARRGRGDRPLFRRRRDGRAPPRPGDVDAATSPPRRSRPRRRLLLASDLVRCARAAGDERGAAGTPRLDAGRHLPHRRFRTAAPRKRAAPRDLAGARAAAVRHRDGATARPRRADDRAESIQRTDA